MQFRGVKVVLRDGLEPTKQVRQDIFNAWETLQGLHRTQPGGQYKYAISGNKSWKVSSLNGVDRIEVLGYKPKVEKKPVEKLIKLKRNYEFVPGICLIIEEDSPKHYYLDGQLASAFISICVTPTWKERRHLMDITPIVEIPTMGIISIKAPANKWPDFIPRGIQGLVEYGISNYNDYDIYDDRDEYTTISNDTGFSPLPYQGNNLSDGAIDYTGKVANDAGAILSGDGWIRSYGDDYIDWWYEMHGSGLGTTWHDETHVWSVPDPAENNCMTHAESDMIVMGGGTCGEGHLMFNLEVQSCKPAADYYTSYIAGMCWPGSPYQGTTPIETLFDGVKGSSQHRVRSITQTAEKWIKTYDIVDRAAGDIMIGTDVYTSSAVDQAYVTAPCAKSQRRNYSLFNPQFNVSGLPGAYVSDTTAGVKPSIELKDKYCMFYTETIYEQTYIAYDPNDWHLSGIPTYEEYWEDGAMHVRYNHRSISTCPGGTLTEKKYLVFYANLNGVKVEIDRADYTDPWYQKFIITDAHVTECMGSTYYMYAYCYKEDYYNLNRIRYGYFKDTAENHIRSEVFVPIGITDSLGRTCLHHDVFGSANFDTPLYGIGKCAGFLVSKLEEYI